MHRIPLKGWLGKALATAALAKLNKCSPDEIIALHYGGNVQVRAAFDAITRAAASIETTTSAAGLVPGVVAEYSNALAQVSAFGQLRSLSVAFDADKVSGSLKVPMRATSRAVKGGCAWVGEAGVLPVSNSQIVAAQLRALKVGGVVPLTRELLDLSAGLAEQVLLEVLAEDAGQLLDETLTDDVAAVEAVRPAGLLAGVTPISSTDAATDLAELAAAAADGAWRLPALIVSPARLASLYQEAGYALQLQSGRLGPFRALVTPFMDNDETLIGLDAAAFISLLAEPEVAASENASLTLASADGSPPTQAVKVDGTIGTPGQVGQASGIMVSGGAVGPATANVIAGSMLQQFAIALRHVTRADWVMGRPNSVAAVEGAAW